MSDAPPPAPSGAEYIRDVALRQFAAQGTSGVSLRSVAAAAGVSVGRVQHHFGTKARLIKAVDDHVLVMLRSQLPGPQSRQAADPVGDFGNHVISLMATHPDVIGYLSRALIEGSEFGAIVFDTLVDRGRARWEALVQQGIARPDLDVTWGALNPILLALAAFMLRTQIERHLPEPFAAPAQLQRWERAVSALIRDGQLRSVDGDGSVG